MKKFSLFSIVFLGTLASLSAQKVDLDKYSFDGGSYYSLPTKPLPADYRTYNVKVESTGTTRSAIADSDVAAKTYIGGWRKLETGSKAHVTFKIILGALSIDKQTIKENNSETKDKEGKVTSTSYTYNVVLDYSIATNYSLLDMAGKVVGGSFGFNTSQTGNFTSQAFNKYGEASSYASNNMDMLRDQFAREQVGTFLKQTSYAVTSNIGLNETVLGGNYWLMDSKKHLEQDSMQMMAKFMKENLRQFKYNTLSADFKEQFKPFMNYMERLPSRYTKDEKGDKKLRYAAYYNLALTYMMLDEPGNAIKYAELLIKNDYDKGDGEDFIKDAKKLSEVYKKAGMSARHQKINLDDFQAPK